jgi:hypothetical protein
VHPPADGLQDFDIERGGAAVVPVVLQLDLPVGVGALDRDLARDAGHEGADVVGQDARVDIDVVRVQDLGEDERGDDGLWEELYGCERVFVWALSFCITFLFNIFIRGSGIGQYLVYLLAFAIVKKNGVKRYVSRGEKMEERADHERTLCPARSSPTRSPRIPRGRARGIRHTDT